MYSISTSILKTFQTFSAKDDVYLLSVCEGLYANAPLILQLVYVSMYYHLYLQVFILDLQTAN